MGYWDKQEASVNGVLGGYGHLSGLDVRDSRAFLKKVRRRGPPGRRLSACPGVPLAWQGASVPALQGPPLRRPQAFGASLAEAEAGRRRLVALDCGAGVGRVTEQLLLQHFAEVDLVEPSGEHVAVCSLPPCMQSAPSCGSQCRWHACC